MPAYKLTVHGGSCKATCDIEEAICILGATNPNYCAIMQALKRFERDDESYVGDFDNNDYEALFALSREYPDASFRLATCDFEQDPENVEVYWFKNADDFGECSDDVSGDAS